MRFVDVNVLVYAHRRESLDHDGYREWLEGARTDLEPLGISDVVMSGFLRIVTNHKIFREPTVTDDAVRFVDQLRASPAYLRAEPSPQVWDRFRELASATGAKGNAIPDTYLAAAAIDLNATLVTADRGFARFDGLRWSHPLN
jgi:toxin-antitoxin system PIN domain toxin